MIITDKDLPERMPLDFYPTDRGLIEAALNRIKITPEYILDPGCGTGRWGMVARLLFPNAFIVGVEIDKEKTPLYDVYDKWYVSDYLEWTNPDNYPFDLITGNPPYYAAEEFIRHSIPFTYAVADIMFLFKIRFLAAIKRANGLFKEYPLWQYDVCLPRPSFYGGGTNDEDYAMFWWTKMEMFLGEPGKFRGGWLYWTHQDKEKRKNGKRAKGSSEAN